MRYHRSLALFFCLCVCTYALALAAAQYRYALFSRFIDDETHFLEAARSFGSGISMDALKNYGEISGPLPFALCGTWGRVFGFGVLSMRLYSLAVALAALVLLHRLFFLALPQKKLAAWAAWFVAINPYMLALSALIYTDVPALLLLLLGALALEANQPVRLGLFTACALLCRHYMAFFPLAVVTVYLARYFLEDNHQRLFMAMAAGASFLPLAFLMVLWKGAAPPSAAWRYMSSEAFFFHPPFLILYVALLFLYVFPFSVLALRRAWKTWKIVTALVLSFSYFLYPVAPAALVAHTGAEPTGFVYRLAQWVSPGRIGLHAVFYLAFALGLIMLVDMVHDFVKRIKNHALDRTWFYETVVLTFLVLMPFSYMCWEKYFLPVLPFALLLILIRRDAYSRIAGL